MSLHSPDLSSPFLQCQTCSRSFTRHEHLQRHLLSHTQIRAFQCQFCSAGFNRRDALVRHWRTCKERISSRLPIPSLARDKRGRKQISCDRCVQRKRRCSHQMPCVGCIEQGDECTYVRFQVSIGSTLPETGSANSTERQVPMSVSETAVNEATVTADKQASSLDAMISRASIDYNSGCAQGLCSEDDAILPWKDTSAPQHTSLDSLPYQRPVWPATPNRYISFMPTISSSLAPVHWPKLVFLARFTSTSGIANSFDCGSSEQRKGLMLGLLSNRDTEDITSGRVTDCSILQSDVGFNQLQFTSYYDNEDVLAPLTMGQDAEAALPGTMFGASEDGSGPSLFEQCCDDLSVKTHEIVMGIREVVQHKSPKSRIKISWSPSREMLCYRFFSPENIERFLVAFWAIWYPNWPVFHKPTFRPTQKPGPLLAGMALIGACLTSERTDRDQAMVWSDAVEEWVFTDDAFCDNNIPQTNDVFEESQIEARLDAIRAAYSVILLLTWEGSEEQKKTSRRTRFSEVVAVARSLVASATVHGDLAHYLTASDPTSSWKAFVLKEEYTRTLLYVFLLDCAYVIFNNCVPRMTVFELQFGTVCPEACFQAETAYNWLQTIKIWAETYTGGHTPLLSHVIESLTVPEVSEENWLMLREMSCLTFFAVASAFHNMIFYHHCGPSPAYSIEVSPITQGLDNWWRAWTSRQPMPGLDMDSADIWDISSHWRKLGFIRYAPEFWNLACIIYMQPLQIQGRVLDVNRGAGGSLRNTYLKTVDESDMEQVHRLIMQFQDMGFGDSSGPLT